MGIIVTDKHPVQPPHLFSLGYYGQKSAGYDYPVKLRVAKPQFIPRDPETHTEKYKRYVWTVLPMLTLIRPLGSIVTVVNEMARIAKSVDLMVKHQTLGSASYYAFQTVLSAGTIGATVIEPSSPLLRRLIIGIQLLSLAHQTALRLCRYDVNDNDEYKFVKLVTHVLNNIVAMISLLSQNHLVIFGFFVLQGATALLHATRQLTKTNYLAASVNVVMGSVRFVQGYNFIYRSLEASLMQELASKQSEAVTTTSQSLYDRARRLMLIDSREPIKEQLSEQEVKIRTLCGEEYLYFKRQGPEEKFLILSTEADHNKGLNPLWTSFMIDKLSKKFDVKFRTVSCVEDVQREIQSATQMGRVTGLMLRAHGSPTSMLLGYDLNNGRLTSQTISADLFAGLDPRCVIVLESCGTASYQHFSIAYRVANLSKRVTFAADDDCYGITLKQLDPLEFSFEKPGKPVKTKRIEPLEDDSLITFLKSLFTAKQENISVQKNPNSN